MTYTVTVQTSYRVGCPDCIADAERLAVQGIRDPQVTSLTLRAVPKCDHPTTPHPPSTALPGQAVLPGLAEMPHSDVNGFDPDMGL
jgi:hypothetical protein